MQFLHFSGPWNNLPEMAPNGARRMFFLLIRTLPTFLAEHMFMLGISCNGPWSLQKVNRAHWPTKEHWQKQIYVSDVSGPRKKENEMAWNGPRAFFVYSSRPCRHFGRHGFWFWEFLCFGFFGIQNFQKSGLGPGLGPRRRRRRRRRRTNSQIPTWPLFQRTQGSNTSQGPLLRLNMDSIAKVSLEFSSTCYGFFQPRKI